MSNQNKPEQEKIETASDKQREIIAEEIQRDLFEQIPDEVKNEIDNYAKSQVEFYNKVIVPMQNFTYSNIKNLKTNKANQQVKLNTFYFETILLQDNETIVKKTSRAKSFVEDLDNGIKIEMIYIPAGEYLMGSDEKEVDEPYLEDWTPQHLVKVPAFFLGKFSITQEQWIAIMENNLSAKQGKNSPINLPVENTSWLDAIEFCKRLSQKTSREYRLPSEAEWEYACRAGTSTLYAYGNRINTNIVNYWDTSDNNAVLETKPVGSYYPNNFGLYDMHGNVYEFCQDAWHDNYEGAPNDGSAWGSEETSNRIVIRGGSFDYYEDDCRSSNRSATPYNYRYHGTGFRVACSI